MMTESIAKEVCKDYRENVIQTINEVRRVSEKRLDDHAKQLDLLTSLTDRLVLIQETFSQQAATSEQRLQILEKQVVEAEKIQHAFQLELQNLKKENKNQPIWKEKWFGISVIICLLILAAIVGVAIGKDILNYVPLTEVG